MLKAVIGKKLTCLPVQCVVQCVAYDICFCCVHQEPLRRGEMLSAYMEIFNMQSQNCSDRSKNNDASLYSTEDLNPGSLIYDQEENHSGNTILYRYLNIW